MLCLKILCVIYPDIMSRSEKYVLQCYSTNVRYLVVSDTLLCCLITYDALSNVTESDDIS